MKTINLFGLLGLFSSARKFHHAQLQRKTSSQPPPWGIFRLLLALFVVACFGIPANGQLLDVGTTPGGGWTFHWDAAAVLEAESHLVTNIPGTFTGANVAPIVGADTFYNVGITGQNTISTSIDPGHIWGGHDTLFHVVNRNNHSTAPGGAYGTPAYDRHATWVGMVMGGRRDAASKDYQEGISYQTDLRSGAVATGWGSPAYASSFSATVTSLDFPFSSAVSGFGTADVINNSWGSIGSAGSAQRQGTDFLAMLTDSLSNGNRFSTFVASAGNAGITIGTNSVSSPAAGYNNITVGALENDGSNNYNSMAGFSSGGAQDYGDPVNGLVPAATAQRAAVDIVAPGTNLTAAHYGGNTGGNDASLPGSTNTAATNLYNGGIAGTSFAAPIVASGVSLMKSAAVANSLPVDSKDTRVIKANMLNAARKIPGWNNSQTPHGNGNGGVVTTQALDLFAGAGALDLDQTYTQYLTGQTDISGINGGATSEVIGWDFAEVDLSSSTDIVITQTLQGGTTFNATLTWFRERTYSSATSQTDVGFADLNLQIWDSTFTTLISESVSQYTPVEHLSFALPSTGTYGLRVSYPQNTFGNLSTEEFGLAWSAVAIPEPASVVLMLFGLNALGAAVRRRSV